MSLKKVLLPVDGSRSSKKAVSYTADLGRIMGLSITLFHVTSSLDEFKDGGLKAILSEYKNILLNSGCEVKVKLSKGRPWIEIVRESHKSYHLIIMGSMGSSGLWRILSSSVAENVVRNSKCPVTIVK